MAAPPPLSQYIYSIIGFSGVNGLVAQLVRAAVM